MRYLFPLLLLCLFSCTDNGNSKIKKSKTQSTATKVYIEYPPNWRHEYNPDSVTQGALLTIYSPMDSNDNFQENISVYHEVLPMRIADTLYHRSAIGQLKINNPTLEVSNLGSVKLGQHQFYHLSFSFDKDQTEYVVHGYNCMKDSVAYNFNFTSTKLKADSLLPIVQDILTSFKPI